MPDASTYLKAFGLKEGLVLAGYRLVKLSIQHIEIERYRRYQYPTSMVWESLSDATSSSLDLLVEELWHMTKESRTVHSRYGNPYLCSFGRLTITENDDKMVIAHATGSAVRQSV